MKNTTGHIDADKTGGTAPALSDYIDWQYAARLRDRRQPTAATADTTGRPTAKPTAETTTARRKTRRTHPANRKPQPTPTVPATEPAAEPIAEPKRPPLHRFDPRVAARTGLAQAVILHTVAELIEDPHARTRHGEWTVISTQRLHVMMPYLSRGAIHYHLDRLIGDGWLRSVRTVPGDPRSRCHWYALGDKTKTLMEGETE